ncbi:hypothetical protein SAMN05216511_0018 [Streptomyces sp. KS_16]|nr:hypothetical protein BX261_0016 [Streptomyces sp. 2321.6]SDQ61748.1 hypothetical protein SAMN05216511_0018 [Streptomyces sp. KS_16]SEB65957.1 hypothetical protein SAMN05428940_0016 [Streptomyces sp. 2133.1]SNC59281.1 hypothetical protein SAMN06272741_0018 [Streptomyces sp. 2114.4]
MPYNAHDVLVELLRESPRAEGSGGRPLTRQEWDAHMDAVAHRAAELNDVDVPAGPAWITEHDKETV